jgi:hypothetical protein
MTESTTAPAVSEGIAVYDALVNGFHESVFAAYEPMGSVNQWGQSKLIRRKNE